MQCPECYEIDTKVIDSRFRKKDFAIKRTRECKACGNRFKSSEMVEYATHRIIKKGRHFSEFSKDRLHFSIKKSLTNDIPDETIDPLVTMINKNLLHTKQSSITVEALTRLIFETVYPENPPIALGLLANSDIDAKQKHDICRQYFISGGATLPAPSQSLNDSEEGEHTKALKGQASLFFLDKINQKRTKN